MKPYELDQFSVPDFMRLVDAAKRDYAEQQRRASSG